MHDRDIYNSDHALFRSNVRRLFREELEPNIDRWKADGVLPREFWEKAGAMGFHCCGIPEEYGGPSVGFSVSSEIMKLVIGRTL